MKRLAFLALGLCYCLGMQAMPALRGADTLSYRVQVSPWSLNFGGTLLYHSDNIVGGSQAHFATQSMIGLDYEVAHHFQVGLQAGVTHYTDGQLLPFRYGIQATYSYPVANMLNLYAKGAVGSQITYQRDWWGNEWTRLESEVPRAWFNLGAGFEWKANSWAIRTGMGYQRQHIRYQSEPGSGGFWEQNNIFRRATFDLTVVLKLNKLVPVD